MNRLPVVRHVFALHLRADRRGAVLIATLIAAHSLSLAAVGISLRWLVNSAGAHLLTAVVVAAAIAAVAHAMMTAAARVQSNLRTDLTERVDLELSQRILRTTAEIPTIDHLTRPAHLDRLRQLIDSTRALAGSCWSSAEYGAALVSLGLSIWLLISAHPTLAALAVFAAAPLWFSQRGERVVREARRQATPDVRLEERMHELCTSSTCAKEVWITGSGPELSRRAGAAWSRVTGLLAVAQLRSAVWDMTGWAVFAAGYALSLGYVTYLVATGRSSVGDIVLVASIASQLRTQVSLAVLGVAQLTEAKHAIDQYNWLQDYSRKARGAATATLPRRLTDGIELKGLNFGYAGARQPVLRDVSVKLPAGTAIALVGVNGAGKTTLVNLLMGTYLPDSGTISVDGQVLSEAAPRDWLSNVSGVFQDFGRFEFLVRDTVGVGDLSRRDDLPAVRQAISQAGAAQFVDDLPRGLATQLGHVFDGVELSQGQWQRLALARGMMRTRPTLLILDEPTAALDPQMENDLYERFIALSHEHGRSTGTITLLVSHRFTSVRTADLILVLADGRIAEIGDHSTLMAQGGRYAKMYSEQAAGYH